MKRILAFIVCVLILCAVPFVASAEEDTTGEVVAEDIPEGENTPETETPTEDENSGDEDYEIGDIFEGEVIVTDETPEDTPPVTEPPVEDETPEEIPEEKPPVENPPAETPPTIEEEVEMVTEQIVAWLTANTEEIGVVITLIGYGIVLFSRLRMLNKSTGTINNNAITISKSSREAIEQALAKIESASGVVTGYDERIVALLEAYKTTAEDKMRLERELAEIRGYLATSSKSNLEFADELAELLSLSNIPNYKKEEIGARHLAAKKEIIDAEAKAEAVVRSLLPTTTEEVKDNVGEEA